jgi:hypothetical protein
MQSRDRVPLYGTAQCGVSWRRKLCGSSFCFLGLNGVSLLHAEQVFMRFDPDAHP